MVEEAAEPAPTLDAAAGGGAADGEATGFSAELKALAISGNIAEVQTLYKARRGGTSKALIPKPGKFTADDYGAALSACQARDVTGKSAAPFIGLVAADMACDPALLELPDEAGVADAQSPLSARLLFNLAVAGCAVAGAPEKALEVIETAAAVGVPLDGDTFAMCLHAISRNQRSRNRMGGSVNVASDAAVARLLMARAMTLLKAAEVPVDAALYRELLPVLVRAKRYSEALGVFDALQLRNLVDAPEYTQGIRAAARARDMGRLHATLEAAYAGGVRLDDDTLLLSLKLLAASKEAKYWLVGKKVFDGIKHKTLPTYHACITVLGHAGKGRSAMEVFTELQASGLPPPRLSLYNSLLYAVSEAGLATETDAVLKMIEDRGLSGNVITFNLAINHLAQDGAWRATLALLREMDENGVAPSEVTFTSAVHAANVGRASAVAVALLKKMGPAGLAPNDATFAAALAACCKDPVASTGSAAAAEICNLMANVGVSESRREQIGAMTRTALARDPSVVDDKEMRRDEQLLGMALQQSQRKQAAV